MQQSITRNNTSVKDTLAYIFNRGSSEGFVIVASDNRVYPILAHSETGNFKYEKGNIVDIEFISRLGAYFKANENNEPQTITPEILDRCYASLPTIASSWTQSASFNKYVIKEHPGCLAGCVAVATAMVMSHCRSGISYHGTIFDLKRINAGLKLGTNSNGTTTRVIGDGGIILPDGEPYTYEEAVDHAAKLLYWIGKDVDMNYDPQKGSGTDSKKAYALLKQEGYNMRHSGLTRYNLNDIIQRLVANDIVYMNGNDYNYWAGHAWVADACTYCVNQWNNNDTVMAEIHCNWGWGDEKYNGYYSGEVFSVDVYNFRDMKYFAVGR